MIWIMRYDESDARACKYLPYANVALATELSRSSCSLGIPAIRHHPVMTASIEYLTANDE